MLDGLKQDIAKQKSDEFVLEAAVAHASDDDGDIQDAFLDDPDLAVIGAENDPEIAKLIDDIPEYDDKENISDEDLEKMEESFIPETLKK